MKSNQDTSQFEPIDAQRALELLEKAVAERGEEYVYPGTGQPGAVCVYVHSDGQPACMVGVALVLHGVPADVLRPVNDQAADSLLIPAIGADAGTVFWAAQREQDGGRTWGEALAAARKVVA